MKIFKTGERCRCCFPDEGNPFGATYIFTQKNEDVNLMRPVEHAQQNCKQKKSCETDDERTQENSGAAKHDHAREYQPVHQHGLVAESGACPERDLKCQNRSDYHCGPAYQAGQAEPV